VRTPAAETRSVHCPGASAWEETHRDLLPEAMMRRDAARALTQSRLLEELKQRAERDQRARREWLQHPSQRSLQEALRRVDDGNVVWLRALIATGTLPTASEIGEYGVHLMWLLFQHAASSPGLQEQALPILVKRYEAGELPATDLSRLVDRILVEQKRPQRFGTQFDWLSGKFRLPDAARVAEIDANRRKLGLMPLADYACWVNQHLDGRFDPGSDPAG
jgi:hypothetical protein